MKNILSTLITLIISTTLIFAQSSGLQSVNNNSHPGYTAKQAKQLLVDNQADITMDGFVEDSPFPPLGEQIKEARLEKGVNVENLANVLGLNSEQMASIEQGQILPTRELLVQIQLFLECELVIDAG